MTYLWWISLKVLSQFISLQPSLVWQDDLTTKLHFFSQVVPSTHRLPGKPGVLGFLIVFSSGCLGLMSNLSSSPLMLGDGFLSVAAVDKLLGTPPVCCPLLTLSRRSPLVLLSITHGLKGYIPSQINLKSLRAGIRQKFIKDSLSRLFFTEIFHAKCQTNVKFSLLSSGKTSCITKHLSIH